MSEADGRGQRVVVVTGGARAGGMGRAIAESFLRLGDAVVLSDVGAPLASHPDYEVAPPDHLSQAATELAVLGPVLPVACDVTDEEQVKALFDAAVAEHGRVDVLVNCAGLAIGLTPVTELALRDWQVNIDVMATGAFLCAREAARRMVPRGAGRIITIASQAGKTGMPLLAAYSASKFAVIGLTQSMAAELGEHGVTVNAICPGTIDTPLLAVQGGVYQTFSGAAGRSEDEYRRRLVRQIPARRFGLPGDVAAAAVYLASEGASFVTGEALNVTGGQEMH
ncbi:SDR family NAD(P)-dependent oxidoreductase [uncultured Nocardioides sp.]|jgi:NAD(P)-dependent dehydrogenase (short-subunit alcohol dehydrogenase family)|uniref:SDR family NAD(P)-dependent oxidoreductase n=1 Tax=uncultured Nocardioides sp. TaxID=198441 RepID=UPI0030F856DE